MEAQLVGLVDGETKAEEPGMRGIPSCPQHDRPELVYLMDSYKNYSCSYTVNNRVDG